ncbi:MAG: HEAT repeat domain-containing protein, partial [Planctomycetota bacterium]
MHRCGHLALLGTLAVALAASAQTQDSSTWSQTDPRYGFLSPIPDHGAVPPIVQTALRPTRQELDFRARVRDYARQIRRVRHEYLGEVRVQALRDQGIAELLKLQDPAAFKPLIEELQREKDDVRLAVFDHLAALGDEGQAALTWVAIHDDDGRMRHEATRRLVAPASKPVLRVLDQGLRSPVHEIANAAGTVAGATYALETIPLLIFAQATADPVENEGDLAWILVATQTAYVAGIEPIVGSGSGAFAVIPGVVQEGVLL